MASLRDVTIIVLEAAWSDTFKVEDGFYPEASVLPYVQSLAVNYGCRVIYRQIRTKLDVEHWCKATKRARLGTRVLWFSGHGEEVAGRTVIRMPDYQKTNGNLVKPKVLCGYIQQAGKVDGVIVDSCSFGRNEPTQWLPSTAKWGLAYGADIDWSSSAYFTLMALEWIYEGGPSLPISGEKAFHRFDNGLRTGRIKRRTDRTDFSSWAKALEVRFFYRKKSGKKWITGTPSISASE